MKIEFEIPGDPQGKERPRHTAYGHTYTPEKTRAYEAKVAWAYKLRAKGFRFPERTPLCVSVCAYYPIPKSATKKERAAMLSGEMRPIVKPDYDNVAKIVTDALNGLAFDDDARIVEARQEKYYAEKGQTKVIVTLSEVEK